MVVDLKWDGLYVMRRVCLLCGLMSLMSLMICEICKVREFCGRGGLGQMTKFWKSDPDPSPRNFDDVNSTSSVQNKLY